MYADTLICVHSPKTIVQWAPLLQKSVEPLDLALCEYSQLTSGKSVTRRQLLKGSEYPLASTLNLDWDYRFEEDYFFRALATNVRMHNSNFLWLLPQLEVDIYECLQRTKEVCPAIDRFLKPVELLGLCSGKGSLETRAIQTCNMFLNFLAKSCEDAEHAIQVMCKLHEMCNSKRDMSVYFFMESTKKCVEYVFKQIQKARCDVFEFLPTLPTELDVLNEPILDAFCNNRFELVSVLLKYGVCFDFSTSVFFLRNRRSPSELRIMELFHNRVPLSAEHMKIIRRMLLILQIIRCIHDPRRLDPTTAKAEKCLQKIWRSLPDPYITEEELLDIGIKPWEHLGEVVNQGYEYSTLMRHHKWYTQYVAETDRICSQPRSLLQYSRCSVRRQLARNFELPGGIPALGLSVWLERYLRLEW